MEKTFDLCFTNPPYTNNIDLNIMTEIFRVCDEIICVHPCGWLLQKKDKKKLFLDYKKLLDENLKSVEIFNGNPIFNIDLVNPCAIYHIKKKYQKPFEVDYFGHKYQTNNIFGISHHMNSWDSLVIPFINIISKYIDLHSSLNSHYVDIKDLVISENKYYCQFTAMQPGTAASDNRMYKDDFWIFIRNETDKYKEVSNNKTSDTLTYIFNSEIERDNFIYYLKTDFARFCLSLLKTHQHLKRGEMSLVPWMDFSQEWTDEKLYKFFNIPQETIDYITNFFPDDFYGLRKKNETK